MASRIALLLLVSFIVAACEAFIPQTTAYSPSSHKNGTRFEKRATISTELSTCGYLNGNPKISRTANSGYNCRVDTQNGLWGFCPTTVLTATDCGLAGACVDDASCSDGCGLTDSTKLTTFTCSSKSFCSTALLTFGVDQTYSYIACGNTATTDHYLISPTTDDTTTSTKSTSTSETSASSNNVSESLSDTTSAAATLITTIILPSSTTSHAQTNSIAAADEDAKGSNSESSNTGPIIGGVIGGLALVCGTAIASIYLLRKNRREKTTRSGEETSQGGDEFPGVQKEHTLRTGGWGPHELYAEPPIVPNRSPVELAG